MLPFLLKIFTNCCPKCKQPLDCQHTSFHCTKVCPSGHYKEESYCYLGVRLIYEERE